MSRTVSRPKKKFPRPKRKASSTEKKACKFCGVLLHSHSVNRHQATKHTVRERFPCNECHKSYPQRTALDSHSRVHNNEYLECCGCDLFITQHDSEMTRHKQRIHGHPRKNRPGVRVEHKTITLLPDEASERKKGYKQWESSRKEGDNVQKPAECTTPPTCHSTPPFREQTFTSAGLTYYQSDYSGDPLCTFSASLDQPTSFEPTYQPLFPNDSQFPSTDLLTNPNQYNGDPGPSIMDIKTSHNPLYIHNVNQVPTLVTDFCHLTMAPYY